MTRPTLLPLFAALLTALLAVPASAGKAAPTTSKESLQTPKESFLDPTEPTKIPEEKPDGKERAPVETIYAYGNTVIITDDCEVDEVRVYTDGVENTYDSSDLKEIYVDLTGTNNWFEYSAGAATNQLIHDRHVVIAGGSQFDTIDLGLTSNEIGFGQLTVQAQIRFDVATGNGLDTLGLRLDHVGENGHLTVDADLGGNDDWCTTAVYGQIRGDLNLHLGGGSNDSVDLFDLLFSCDVLPGGSLNLMCHGGHNYDSVKCRYRGIVEGNAAFYLYGNDFYDLETLPIDFSNFSDEDKWYLAELNKKERDSMLLEIQLEEGSNGNVTATVEDGLGDDDLAVQIYQDAGSNAAIDAELNGGYGYDWWYATGHNGEPGEFVEIDNVESFDPGLALD
ncbi:hypothetical protein Mal4_38210 [Maioricimonas rarisocia]|uniref:Uncharacterized protein n=1 Tax=Maioricimonas rarisocia TaxID=2528026 RepID=A0A517ZAF8_9PLAN|nr:hypothetical protein [Maioricimonas rarisocia]QDU39476.1 hypothetical protein Mal4_38210 [Maioricimonas rarisocia]